MSKRQRGQRLSKNPERAEERADGFARYRRWAARVALALLAPVLFLLLIEGVLALTGWVEPVRLLKRVEHEGKAYWTTHPEYGRIWYDRINSPTPSHIWIPVERDTENIRIVVIGESAAAGFPYYELSLATVLEAVWELMLPDQPVEVINLSMTGINSHTLVEFAREAMQLRPDALIVYAGNNEAIGPFGPAAITALKLPPRWIVKSLVRIRSSRVGQLVSLTVEQLASTSLVPSKPFWAGLDEHAGQNIVWRDPALLKMNQVFSENIHEIAHVAHNNNVPVLLAAPAVNLTDWPPLGDEPSLISDNEALSLWRMGQKEALVSASQVYRLAERERDRGDYNQARLLFDFARDLDPVRIRADSRIQEALRSVADTYPNRTVFLNTDRALRADESRLISDSELFLEHVHLSARGLFEVSRLVGEELLPLIADHELEGPPPEWTQVSSKLWITEFDHFLALERILSFAEFDVFSNQKYLDERRQRISQELRRLRSILDDSWSVDRINQERAVALARGAPVERVHFAAALMFMVKKKSGLEEAAFREHIKYRPRDPDAWLNYANSLVVNEKFDEARAALDQLRLLMPSLYKLDALEGEVLARLGLLAEAEYKLKRALRKTPRNYVAMRNLLNVLMMSAQYDEAIEWSRLYLEENDADASAMNNLAWFLATDEDSDPADLIEATDLAVRALEFVPNEPSFMGTLAVCYAASGRQDLAREWYNRAIRSTTYSNESRSILIRELARHDVHVLSPD